MICAPQRYLANLAVAGLAALACAVEAHPADARSRRDSTPADFVAPRAAGMPLMAIVSLSDQRITIYDAQGKILQAPVSTGQSGYETPAGIYSVIQKEAEHYSNLYDDASMPFMQRITWSGIALHAGVLPGRPASHGCIRMPHGFAERLFEVTKLGLRVVIVRDDMRPVEIAHPALFKPGPIRSQLAAATPEADQSTDAMSPRRMRLGAATDTSTAVPRTWRAVAVAKRAEAEKAAEKVEEARRAAVRANVDAVRFVKPLRMAEGAKRRAEIQLENAERELEANSSPKAEEAKAAAIARLNEAKAHFEALQAEGQPKIDALAAAREAVRVAEAARVAAVTGAKIAENKSAPVSVFISRQTQRLYVRQGFRPMFESEVTIRDPETPIGTTIFTAVGDLDGGADVRWTALAMYAKAELADPAPAGRQRRAAHRQAEPAATDAGAAKAALERIAIPQEAIDRIAEFVSPGSALIVSDEALSRETSTGTDFIVLMSGEPQGGIKIRRRNPYNGSERYFRRSPYGGNPFSWW
jgi:hypothetical protein